MLVSSILKTKGTHVDTAPWDASLGDAARQLMGHRIGALVVLDSERNVFGVLAEADVIRAFVRHGVAAFKKPIHTALARPLVTCAPDDSLEQAMATMTRERKWHLPVFRGEKLLGIVTLDDLARSQLVGEKVDTESREDGRTRRRGSARAQSEAAAFASE